MRHTAGVVASRPVAVTFVCAVIGTGAIVPPLLVWPGAVPQAVERNQAQSAGPEMPAEFFALPPGLPAALLAPQQFEIGPGGIRDVTPQSETPSAVTEPGSVALLATAVAALIAWRTRA